MQAKLMKRIARKDYPQFGVKKGEEHYTWRTWQGGTFRSKSKPTKSQRETISALAEVYTIVEFVESEYMVNKEELINIIGQLEDARYELVSFIDKFIKTGFKSTNKRFGLLLSKFDEMIENLKLEADTEKEDFKQEILVELKKV